MPLEWVLLTAQLSETVTDRKRRTSRSLDRKSATEPPAGLAVRPASSRPARGSSGCSPEDRRPILGLLIWPSTGISRSAGGSPKCLARKRYACSRLSS